MENFILYDEISNLDGTITYKGRRRGTIDFVAIMCTMKEKRSQVTNHVRLSHDMKHENIVIFHEWYETSNHLWLVQELCVGGTLNALIIQDGSLPEGSIQKFATDIVKGLMYVHSLKIVFGDLNPDKVQFDSSGTFKLADFGFSWIAGEDLSEILNEFSDGELPDSSHFGCLNFMAPECLSNEKVNQAADFWSLGCLLFFMYVTEPPFVADSLDDLQLLVNNSVCPNVLEIGKSRQLSDVSNDFRLIVEGLIDKDTSLRFGWNKIMSHPFWGDRLQAEGVSSASNLLSPPKVAHPDPSSGDGSTFSLSTAGSRCSSVMDTAKDQMSPNKTMTADFSLLSVSNMGGIADQIRPLITVGEDFRMTPLIGNPKIAKLPSLHFEAKSLPVPPFSSNKLKSLDESERSKQFTAIVEQLGAQEKGPASMKRLHFVSYLTSLLVDPVCAHGLLIAGALEALMKLLKSVGNQTDYRNRVFRAIGLIACHTKAWPEGVELLKTSIATLTEMLRDNFRNSSLKTVLLPSLGELILIGLRSCPPNEAMNLVPSLTITTILRCLRSEPGNIVVHYAIELIKNMVILSSAFVERLLADGTASLLWQLFISAPLENARTSSILALLAFSKHDSQATSHVIEKFGERCIGEALTSKIAAEQQALATLLLQMTCSGTSPRLLSGNDFIFEVFRMLESVDATLRAKAYLLLLMVISSHPQMLRTCIDKKLVQCLERDLRNCQPDKDEYLMKCVHLIVHYLSMSAQTCLGEMVQALGEISGRKHPSQAQNKKLKQSLPTIVFVQQLLASPVFGSDLLTDSFINALALLLALANEIDLRETSIDHLIDPTSECTLTDKKALKIRNQAPSCSISTEPAQQLKDTIFRGLYDFVIR